MNRCPRCQIGILADSRTDRGDKECAWCGHIEYARVADPLIEAVQNGRVRTPTTVKE